MNKKMKTSLQSKRQACLLLLGILCIAPARGQLKSELNMFRSGDLIFKQQVEYKNPGRSGESVLWDFSRLTSIDDSYTLEYSTPDSIVIAGSEHHTRYYYSLSGDSLLCHGYENATTLMVNERPELLLRFPVAYGDSTFCYYNGNGKYCDRLEVSAMGTVSSKADARGMMILPDGDTLKNVLRVHTVKKIAYGTKPLFFHGENAPYTFVSNDSIGYRLASDSLLMELDTYRWYTEGYRYPVFETVKSITNKHGQESEFFNTAFFYPPQDHYYLETDPENKKIVEAQNKGKKEDPLAGSTFNAYPNPMGSTLEVEVFIPVEAKIKVQVRSVVNKSVYINENKGKFAPGSHHFQFNVSKLPQGYYLINIWADNYLLSETLLKQ